MSLGIQTPTTISRTWAKANAGRMWLKRNPQPDPLKLTFDPDRAVYYLAPLSQGTDAEPDACLGTQAEAIPQIEAEPVPAEADTPREAQSDIQPQSEEAKPEVKVKIRASHQAALDMAAEGDMPTPPDFTAATHKPYRAKLAKLIALAQAGDIRGLNAVVINPTSTSPKALLKYRDLCVMALKARRKMSKAL